MSSSTNSTSQNQRIWIPSLHQWMNVGGSRPNPIPQQVSMPQLPPHQVMNVSQFVQNNFFSPGVAATNGYPAGFVPNQQQFHTPGMPQPAYSPGVAATNSFSAGYAPNQQHFASPGMPQPVYSPGVAATNSFSAGYAPDQQNMTPQAQPFGGAQYSQNGHTAPAQGQYMAQNTVNTSPPRHHRRDQQQQEQQHQQQRNFIDSASNGQCIDLTGDDDEEVLPPAPTTPDIPVPSAPSLPSQEVAPTHLPTPADTPEYIPRPKTSTPEAPSHLAERLKHLKLTVHAGEYPCAFRLLSSFHTQNKAQQRNYSALFWPSNQEALEDLLRMAKLSPNFSEIYLHRIRWHAEEKKIDEIEDPVQKAKALAAYEAKGRAEAADMERKCKLLLQDLLADEGLGNFHQTIGNVRGHKNKGYTKAQQETFEEEKERARLERERRWASLNPELGPDELGAPKRKRDDGEEEVAPAPAPAPKKKRGRPPKDRSGEQVVEKVKKRRGRPPKVAAAVVAQEPPPDHTLEEDDDELAAALLAGFMEDAGDEEASVEDPCQLQGPGEESDNNAATTEDIMAAFLEDDPVAENVVEEDAPPQELGQEQEDGVQSAARDDDMDSLFDDDTDSLFNDDTDSLFDDDKDSLFDE